MPNYVQDRIFNKIVCVHDVIYFTDSTNLFSLEFGTNQDNNINDIKIQLIRRFFGMKSIRLYQFYNQMLIRDAESGTLWIMGPDNQVVAQNLNCQFLKFSLFTETGLFGENLDTRKSIMLKMKNNQVSLIERENYTTVRHYTRDGEYPHKDFIEFSLNMSEQEYYEDYETEIKLMNNAIKDAPSFNQYKTNHFYILNPEFFIWLYGNNKEQKFCGKKADYMIFYIQQHDSQLLKDFLVDYKCEDINSIAILLQSQIDVNIIKLSLPSINDKQKMEFYDFISQNFTNLCKFVKNIFDFPYQFVSYDIQKQVKVNAEELNLYTKSEHIAFLYDAIIDENLSVLQLLIDSIPSYLFQQMQKPSPIKVCLHSWKPNILQYLQKYQLLYNKGDTDLIMSVKYDCEVGIKLFINQLNKQNNCGQSALMFAVQKLSVNIVSLLISESGLRDQQGNTALILAIQNRNFSVVKLLIDEVQAVNVSGKCATIYGIEMKMPEKLIIQLFQKEFNLVFSKSSLIRQQQLEKYQNIAFCKCRICGRSILEKLAFKQSPFFTNSFINYDRDILIQLLNQQFTKII